ncbi:MAG: hypothetical protein JJU32_07880 [Phormidium sp. BM_Day4_Bin.17]|nr:hypothetical protein [Phormidium sp. BM_Day4_Bin.17]UCJ11832.1 MAG: hypothetical protein JWS08_19200 [Phormidium sp. PBR-2020]
MKLLPLSLGIALGLLWSSPALAQSRDQVVRLCLNGLLHTDISHDGTPRLNSRRTVVDQASAAEACEGVQTRIEAREIRRCVLGVLYTNTDHSGGPRVTSQRTEIEASSAARACRLPQRESPVQIRYRYRLPFPRRY